ncbi:MAG TPA: hypothetical protein VM553_21040 [Dongiaceae bacterium]|nr:hypothetical protein [Dongiaceae bacterium]
MHPDTLPGFNRRGFLKLGLVGSGLLLGAGLLGSLHGCATHQPKTASSQPMKVLREKDAVILSAIAPVVLKGNFPTEPAARQQALDRFLTDIDELLAHTSEYAHGELAKMFDLLYLMPTRGLMTGIWSDWQDASEEDIDAFLVDWRDSSFNLFRMGYAQLSQLTCLVYYSAPENWTAEMYPGPPQHIPG